MFVLPREDYRIDIDYLRFYDINAEGLDALAEEIKSIGANVTSYICDVSDE